MIATAFFTGKVINKLEVIHKSNGRQLLSVLLRIKKPNLKEKFFYLEAYDSEALHFIQKVSAGDFVSIVAEPYSSLKKDVIKAKESYIQGYKIVLFEVLKKGDIKWVQKWKGILLQNIKQDIFHR